MNSKSYRLLRNNKEQGPFTLEELIVKGLKPYDLIWVDGRSAAWSYPGEMTEFKNYVPNPEDYRTNLIITKQETVARVSNAVQAAVAVNDNLVQAGIKQKPRYKVSAAWSKIQTITTPSYADVIVAEPKKNSSAKIINTAATQAVNAKSLSWEQAWLDWENEKKTSAPVKPETFLKIPAAPKRSINETARTAPVLEKKFEQSLDTITDKYIDNLLLQKKKSKGFSFGKSSEFILPSLALIIIFSIGYWLMHNSNKTASAIITAPVKQQTVAANDNKQSASNINGDAADNNENVTAQVIQPAKNNTAIHKPVGTNAVKEKTLERYTKNASILSSVKTNSTSNGNGASNKNVQANSDINLKKRVASNNKQFDPTVINNIPADKSYNDPSSNNNGDLNAAQNRPVRRRTNNVDATNNTTSQADNVGIKNTKVKSALNYVNVPEYVTMNNGNGSLKVQNISDADLDLVVVDVQYFDASSRFRKGETLYLHNLKAGKTVTIKTPRDINSSYATSKVSLVSSDANNVYAVGDN
jgi:hypothetical protein